MMKKICFATNNRHKLSEVQAALNNEYQLVTLEEIGCFDDIPEEEPTIAANSLSKAQYVWKRFSVNCFADDTGLEVEALNGDPGVYSARYAGEHKNSEDNIALLLKNLGQNPNRKARFLTVFTLILEGKVFQFEGMIEGEILLEKRGAKGFGYDSVFLPKGYTQTFAEMDLSLKNQISHRGLAVKQLVEFLRTV